MNQLVNQLAVQLVNQIDAIAATKTLPMSATNTTIVTILRNPGVIPPP